MEIGEKIKRAREAKGLTQQELGAACGSIGRWFKSSHSDHQKNAKVLKSQDFLDFGVFAFYVVKYCEILRYC